MPIGEETNIAGLLHEQITLVCPIVGVSIGDPEDKQTWSITYDASATQAQQDAADAVMAAFDPDNPEPTTKQVETLRGKEGYRPLDVLFYYGYPNSFNSAVNGWSNEKVAQDMAKYEMIVLGNGVANSSHPDYSNTVQILPRIKEINPLVKIFGYVACTETVGDFATKADEWNDLDIDGIFGDEAGYDFSVSRADQNARIDIVHGLSSANIAFMNAWTTDHLIGTTDDVSYPNSTWNPSLTASRLLSSDWILMESFPINTTAYSGSGGYEAKADWLARGTKIVSLRNSFDINFCGLGMINDDNEDGNSLFDFGYISALMWSVEAFGTSSTSYGASTAQVQWWTRPDITNLKDVFSYDPVVVTDASDSDVAFRFIRKAKLTLDFSDAAQTSSITKR